jgi:hypothetical protein
MTLSKLSALRASGNRPRWQQSRMTKPDDADHDKT